MRSLISVALLSLLGLAACRGAPVTELWPTQVASAPDAAALTQRLASLDAAAASMSPELGPALQFQKAFERAVSRAPQPDWLPVMKSFATATGTDAVAVGLREVSRAWVARVEALDIGKVLDGYYAQNVRYPADFREIEQMLPATLRLDPWGQPWVYRPHAPQGFAKETRQRYQLGPTRFPDLGTLREATAERRPFAPHVWTVALRVAGENRALEFRVGGAVIGLISAGGVVDGYPLLYVGDHWALMAGPDQLFTIAF